MAISRLSAPPFRNKLLDLLKENDYRRLQPHLELVRLEFKQILYEPRALMNYAYFPREGVTSLITLMENGSGIEVASVGREGIVGVGLLFGVEKALARIIVQVPGTALRMERDILRDEISQDTPLRRLLFLYERALFRQVMQLVACNGLHSLLQRCCRWLLTTRDRIDSDQFVMTRHDPRIFGGNPWSSAVQRVGGSRDAAEERLDPLSTRHNSDSQSQRFGKLCLRMLPERQRGV